ncbi:MAG: hypothetical protein GW780_02740 [Candidatus Aenigmarchaeota archaeon]|nr:hypothetical protein [Candidatus Aenigmarchaeota archaeon]NCO96846.1 hypothetical protein [Candidatus Aenigmarchaeota archaeon]NCS71062.1 hypothetical protein [Candidatus Aenigmarchaeota archaeon]
MIDNPYNWIACNKPAEYIVLTSEKNSMKVSFCADHIKGCLACGKCEIEKIN